MSHCPFNFRNGSCRNFDQICYEIGSSCNYPGSILRTVDSHVKTSAVKIKKGAAESYFSSRIYFCSVQTNKFVLILMFSSTKVSTKMLWLFPRTFFAFWGQRTFSFVSFKKRGKNGARGGSQTLLTWLVKTFGLGDIFCPFLFLWKTRKLPVLCVIVEMQKVRDFWRTL